MPLAGAGMRRHVHSGNHAAESFVSFMPLFGRLASSCVPRPYSRIGRQRVRYGCIERHRLAVLELL
jgi:hypothetical protein